MIHDMVQDDEIPRDDKCYLGDGLYAIRYANGVYLQSHDGEKALHTVWLEETGIVALVEFAKKKKLYG
jgi:hypothetical protein